MADNSSTFTHPQYLAAMDITKPTIVLVPGAFHVHSCLDQVIAEFHSAGYETRTATLRSVNSASASATDDFTLIREELLLHLIDDEKDVVVVFHSYAGVPGGTAIMGLCKNERTSNGEESGVIGLVYMCALIAKEGTSPYDMAGGQWAPWQKADVSSLVSLLFLFPFTMHEQDPAKSGLSIAVLP